MPIYTYKCKKCGKVFEWTQSINSKPLEYCPEEICEEKPYGKGEVERVISKNIGLIFKGNGFYLTDYSKKNSSTASTSSSEHSSSGKANESDTSNSAKYNSVGDDSKSDAKNYANSEVVSKNSSKT